MAKKINADEVLMWKKAGHTQKEIAKIFGVSTRTVSRYWKQPGETPDEELSSTDRLIQTIAGLSKKIDRTLSQPDDNSKSMIALGQLLSQINRSLSLLQKESEPVVNTEVNEVVEVSPPLPPKDFQLTQLEQFMMLVEAFPEDYPDCQNCEFYNKVMELLYWAKKKGMLKALEKKGAVVRIEYGG